MKQDAVAIGHSAPPGMLGMCILFWGWQTGLLFLAVPLAAMIEGYHLLSWRWAVTDSTLGRSWTFCLVSFLVLVIIALLNQEGVRTIYFVMTWVPLVILPMVLVQVYSTREGVPLRAISLLARYADKVSRKENPGEEPLMINIEMPFAFIVLCAASTPNHPGKAYYLCISALLGWAMLVNPFRPRRPAWQWSVAFAVVFLMGYAGHIGLHRLHLYIEQKAIDAAINSNQIDPDQSVTHIGRLGELKQSGRVMWRVKEVVGRAPAYLRQASYNAYRRGTWYNVGYRKFDALQKYTFSSLEQSGPASSTDWKIHDTTPGKYRGRLRLSGPAHGEYAHLSLPETTTMIEDVNGGLVSRNALGVTRVRDPDRLLSFYAEFEHGLHGDEPWDRSFGDLGVPTAEREMLITLVRRLRLTNRDFQGSVKRLSDWFHSEFTYSLNADIPSRSFPGQPSPLETFLLTVKQGHCEYYATATVLLLRQAGIPARYVTGYSVQEYDPKTEQYLLRGMHAHAWAQVWDGKEWQTVDNTPGVWAQQDRGVMGGAQGLVDWFDSIPYFLEEWKMTVAGQTVMAVLKWGSLPVFLLYVLMRLFKGEQSERVSLKDGTRVLSSRLGEDSEWFEVEARLSERTRPRHEGETCLQWQRQIMKEYGLPAEWNIARIIALHYRLRFDPEGLSESERGELASQSSRVLQGLESLSPIS
jgi:hypothetical protein